MSVLWREVMNFQSCWTVSTSPVRQRRSATTETLYVPKDIRGLCLAGLPEYLDCFQDRDCDSQEKEEASGGCVVWHVLRGGIPKPHTWLNLRNRPIVCLTKLDFNLEQMARILWNFSFSVKATLVSREWYCQANGSPFHSVSAVACERQPVMPRNGSLTLTKWPLVPFHTGILKTVAVVGLLERFFAMPRSLKCWRQWWHFLPIPSWKKRKKPNKSFSASKTDGLTLKMLLVAAELNPVTAVIVILVVGCWICLLNFPFSMDKRGQPRYMRYCCGERDHRQLGFPYPDQFRVMNL